METKERIKLKNKKPVIITFDQKDNELRILKSGKYYFLYDNKNENLKVTIDILNNLDVIIYEYYKTSRKNDVLLEVNYNISNNNNINYNSFNNNELLKITKKINFNVAASSTLKAYNLELGNNSTVEYNINLKEEQSSVNFNLMVYADKNNLKDYKVNINHLNPFTYSIINNRAVLNHHANCFFDVQTYIKKGAYKSEAIQESQILTLSDTCGAEINPKLLIDEYDVIGSHSASCGKINSEIIDYMQSRGIDKTLASQLIGVGNLLKNVDKRIIKKTQKKIEKRMNYKGFESDW